MTAPFLRIAGWFRRARCVLPKTSAGASVMCEQGHQADSSGEDTANGLRSHYGLSAPPRVCQSLWGRPVGEICLGSPGLPTSTASGPAAGRPPDWGSVEGNRASLYAARPSSDHHGDWCRRDTCPQVAGRCDGSEHLGAVIPACPSLGSHTPSQPGPPMPLPLPSHPSGAPCSPFFPPSLLSFLHHLLGAA